MFNDNLDEGVKLLSRLHLHTTLLRADDVAAAVANVRARVGHMVKVEIEVDTLDQLREVLEHKVDAVLLDNMAPPTLREAVAIVGGRIPLEASGGINFETIRAKAESGVNFISTSKITQSAPAVDIGLDDAAGA